LADKDEMLAEQRAAIDDLRRRLDRADEQRQQAQIQLAALLPAPPASEPPRTKWRFLTWRRRP
jgi:outer membrane protein TolC